MSMFGAVDLSTLAPTTPARTSPAGSTPSPAAAGQELAGSHAQGVPAPLIVDVDAASLRDVADVSTRVPVILILHTPRSQASTALAELLSRLAEEYQGRFELARVDIDAAPEVAQAFQVQSVPAIVALIGGQPVPVLQGTIEEPSLRELLERVLEVAAANGVTGRLDLGREAPAEPEESEVERQVREAMERGDYAAAEAVYDHAIAQSPGDGDLRAGRAQVRVLIRMEGKDPTELLAAADANPQDVDAALAGADASLAMGDIDACLGRALEAVRSHQGEERETARLRLLELFEVIGSTSPEVARARRHLASILY